MPNKQEIWRPISFPVTSETHKLIFSNYVTDKVNGSRVQPSLSGRNKDRTRESGGNRAYSQMCDDTACEYGALVRGECGSSTKYPSTEYVRIGECNRSIALFTVTFSHLHYNVFDRGCEAISGNFAVSARNCLTFAFKCIVMQMRKGNCEKGY